MLDARYIQEAAALLNPETFIILQKHPSYSGNLHSEAWIDVCTAAVKSLLIVMALLQQKP